MTASGATASGATAKARRDMTRRNAEQAAGAILIRRLRKEAGAIAADPPTRIVRSKLREMALA